MLRRAVPVLVFHGNSDPYVAPVNATQTLAQFAQLNDLADDGIDNDSVTTDPIVTARGVNFSLVRYSLVARRHGRRVENQRRHGRRTP